MGVRELTASRRRCSGGIGNGASAARATRRSISSATASASPWRACSISHRGLSGMNRRKQKNTEAEDRSDAESSPPAPVRGQGPRLQKQDRARGSKRGTDPEAAVDRQVGAAAKTRRYKLLDGRVDRRVLAADASAGQSPEEREACEIPRG